MQAIQPGDYCIGYTLHLYGNIFSYTWQLLCLCFHLRVVALEISKIYIPDSAIHTYVIGQWPTWWHFPIGGWAVNLGSHVLITVSVQGTNKPLGVTNSFIKSQNSTACILSFVVQIQLNILHDIDKSVFLIVIKFRNDAKSHCSIVTKLTLDVRGPSYLGLTRSISWLLMPWLLTSPGHQQSWYWPCSICRSWSYMRKHFKYMYLCHINVE